MLTFPPDFTFFVQIVSFLVLWLVLRQLAWAPMLRVLEERDQRTIGNRKIASQCQAEAERAQRTYDEALAQARVDITAKLQSARSAIAAEEQKILSEARAAAQRRLNDARDQLNRDLREAREAALQQAQDLGRFLARQILGREVG
ncbi:MAG: hypothetical protein KatS3mg077_2311 [Candidatus Binatia bacterium]|nr:MAG: hypothetical protein KatS3mg077_2311 [Candidatus Binatia bacterium]